MPRLEFRDVRISYTTQGSSGRGTIHAVDGVDLVVEPGSTLGLAGESGCGKSTLAMSVLRLLPANAKVTGQVLLGEENVSELSWGRLRAVRWSEAAIVFQGAMHSLNPVQRIRDQIGEALLIHATGDSAKYKQEQARLKRVHDLLALVDIPRSKAESYPHELSGGQKQRIMIAMALACEPDIIIADEPTTALDVIVQAQVLDVLTGLVRDRGLSLIMISHDLSVLAATCERIVVMQQGRIVEQGPSAEVMGNPQHPHTQALAAAFPTIGDYSSRLRLPKYAALNAPSLDAAERRDTPQPKQPIEPLLVAENISVVFGGANKGHVAVDGVNLVCGRGEIVALVGQSGSGKTTLARTVLGLQQPTSGAIHFEGKPLSTQRKKLKEYRRQVQFVLQDPTSALNPKHSIYEAVAEGPRLHKMPGDETEIVARALSAAELSPAEKYMTAIPQELSGGQRQRVVIAGALALDPSFIVADEPVASLDASVRAEILALLLKLKCELGLGALVITHDLGLAWNIADRVAVMYQGRIVEEGTVEEVLLSPKHEYTKRLLSVVPTNVLAENPADTEIDADQPMLVYRDEDEQTKTSPKGLRT
ncbi:ABC transporter ATP-binding protein [Paenarthrobacter sp. OM7]|uniref:Nickel ABC transporter ATP-binding protein NikE n=1 Tax=Paenarthrobacter sp. AMU7 TaxID=3162492 RepID=A0AB39YR36_9MICC|nr:ABC transporter ATP-binding protein [Paenarthrobacter sp. OM7]WGM20446.1 ABC transporter ATP-binding protein [Paenarthrobacter sp. OM7]